MNLKALIAAAAVSATVLGGVATAEAKPQQQTLKHCKKNDNGNSKRMVCQTGDGKTVEGTCPGSYDPVKLVELGPGNESYDVNANGILCYDAVQGTIDDNPHG